MFKRKNRIRFKAIDPLGDGLAEEIAAEREVHKDTMMLVDVTPEELSSFWNNVINDVRNDPNWFSFTEE